MGLKKLKNDKLIFILSGIIWIYFCIVIGSYYLNFSNVLLGIFNEMFTIPAVLLLIILLYFAGTSLLKANKKLTSLPFYSFLMLIFTSILIVLATWGF